MTEVSDKGREILDDLPVYAQDDRLVQGLVDSAARELQRIEDFLASLKTVLNPTEADDTYGTLGYWERFLGLPVEPTGASEQQRRNTIIAAVEKRNAEAGTGWYSLIEAVLEGAPWTHSENTDETGAYAQYELAITGVEIETTDYRNGIFQQMVNQITPAHIQISEIEIAGDDTFRVGISEVGDTI